MSAVLSITADELGEGDEGAFAGGEVGAVEISKGAVPDVGEVEIVGTHPHTPLDSVEDRRRAVSTAASRRLQVSGRQARCGTPTPATT
jgi:hypothetical protein